ncbi:NUDIX domain-containing protein [Candidatus Bipolaricaulota bacterium]
MTQHYYLESDGRIFLILRGDKLDLPTEDEIPFQFDVIAPLTSSSQVLFCTPLLEKHPSDWMRKDAVPTDLRVTARVREAVHASMPRVVSEGVFVRNGLVLLLKGSRGLTKDRWTLPGGFVRFGEGPVEGLLREIKEELGVHAEIGELLAVRSKLGERTLLHWIQFFYRVTIFGELKPDPDEIAAAQFFEPAEGAQRLDDSLMREVIESLI